MVIQVEQLTAGYGGIRAVENVSFRIERGAFMGIIGPNGAGKSTLFSCMLGLKRDYGGQIMIHGKNVRKRGMHPAKVGYVPQNTSFAENFPATARDVVRMGVQGKDNSEDMLKQFWMHELADRRIGELSGGQQQRVFIARAMANKPDLLILDEPSTGVDAASISIFYSILEEINRAGVTIVWSTHDMEAVKKYSTTMMYINRTVFFDGKTGDFFSDPKLVELCTCGQKDNKCTFTVD